MRIRRCLREGQVWRVINDQSSASDMPSLVPLQPCDFGEWHDVQDLWPENEISWTTNLNRDFLSFTCHRVTLEDPIPQYGRHICLYPLCFLTLVSKRLVL